MAAAPAVSSLAYQRPTPSLLHTPTPKPSTSHLSVLPAANPKLLHSPLSTSRPTSQTLAEAETVTSPPPRPRNRRPFRPKRGKAEDLYLGHEMWSPPVPPQAPKPKVRKPYTVHDAASLAYIGDCMYMLYAKRHFLYPPLSIDVYNERVRSLVRCEAQATLLKKILQEDFLTEEERDILQWGRNIGSSKTKTRKRAGVAVYKSASSLETLIGHLYLTDMKHLEELMSKLGFSTGASSERIVEKKEKLLVKSV